MPQDFWDKAQSEIFTAQKHEVNIYEASQNVEQKMASNHQTQHSPTALPPHLSTQN